MRHLSLALCLLALGCAAQEGEPGAEPGAEGEKEEKSKRDIVAQYSYCQEDDCYALLGVKKTSAQPAIKRAYRKLAAEWHPDKNPDPRAKDLFQKYANAYEVLSSPEMRNNYDYLMEHPQEFPMFFMRYSRPTYMPKSDLRFVVALTIMIISAIQYLFQQSQYKTTLSAIKKSPQYQDKLKKYTKEMSEKPSAAAKKSGFRGDAGTTKGKKEQPKAEALEEFKKEAEAKLDAELASEMPSEPKLKDTVAVAFFKSPLTVGYALQFHVGWFVNFKLLGKAYGPEEMEYLTKKAAGISDKDWEDADEKDKEDLIGKELWVAENLEEWETELAKEYGGDGKKSGKEKRMQRQKKKGPIGNVGMLE